MESKSEEIINELCNTIEKRSKRYIKSLPNKRIIAKLMENDINNVFNKYNLESNCEIIFSKIIRSIDEKFPDTFKNKHFRIRVDIPYSNSRLELIIKLKYIQHKNDNREVKNERSRN